MSVAVANWIAGLLAAYGFIGFLFAVPFVALGIGRIDSRAKDAGIGFRLVVFPGVVAFWPLLLGRWLRRGAAHDPLDRQQE